MFKRVSVLGALVVFAATDLARGSIIYNLSDVSGLSAEVEFDLPNATTLTIRLKNTSTGVPGGFDSADQLLTGVSWDFGHPGFNGDSMITGGSVIIGPSSASMNFTTGLYGPGFDVSGEWGYGNMDGTGALTNFLSANAAQGTPLGGVNLDGPANIDGPQGGLVANPVLVSLGGLGAIQNEIFATLSLSDPITLQELEDDLEGNFVRVEFGSDAHFIMTPDPATIGLVTLGSLAIFRRSRRQ
jgi:hypothetical protein